MELRHTYNRNGKIYHARCAYKTDIEDVRCDCDKVLIELPLYRPVYVCRNYWAELLNRAKERYGWRCDKVFYAKYLLMQDTMPDSLFVRAGLPTHIRNSKRMRNEGTKCFSGIYSISGRNEGLCPNVIFDFDDRGLVLYSARSVINAIMNHYRFSVDEFSEKWVHSLVWDIFQSIRQELDRNNIKYTAKSFNFPKRIPNIADAEIRENIFSMRVLRAMAELLNCMAYSKDSREFKRKVKLKL